MLCPVIPREQKHTRLGCGHRCQRLHPVVVDKDDSVFVHSYVQGTKGKGERLTRAQDGSGSEGEWTSWTRKWYGGDALPRSSPQQAS